MKPKKEQAPTFAAHAGAEFATLKSHSSEFNPLGVVLNGINDKLHEIALKQSEEIERTVIKFMADNDLTYKEFISGYEIKRDLDILPGTHESSESGFGCKAELSITIQRKEKPLVLDLSEFVHSVETHLREYWGGPNPRPERIKVHPTRYSQLTHSDIKNTSGPYSLFGVPLEPDPAVGFNNVKVEGGAKT